MSKHESHWAPVRGAGLGLRRELLDDAVGGLPAAVSFLEVAPENWMGIGGRLGKQFRKCTERHAFVTHGLSLSLGSPDRLDTAFVKRIKAFLDAHDVRYCTEHLSYCSADGHLYDLMPIPFTAAAVKHVARRIRHVQDILEREIAVENVSYYAAPGAEMTELAFVNAVLDEADCGLLLDVNNVVVNSINHRYDATDFLDGLPADRVRYLHVAGHYVEAEDLRVDTHGSSVSDPVWTLLEHAYARLGPVPTLLERDFNIPPLTELLDEMKMILARQRPAQREAARAG